jgi:hypothetical protein
MGIYAFSFLAVNRHRLTERGSSDSNTDTRSRCWREASHLSIDWGNLLIWETCGYVRSARSISSLFTTRPIAPRGQFKLLLMEPRVNLFRCFSGEIAVILTVFAEFYGNVS